MEKKPDETNQLESLEDPETTTGSTVDDSNSLESVDTPEPVKTKPIKKKRSFKDIISHVNVYVLLFILIIIIASGIVFVGSQSNKKADSPTTLASKGLSADEIKTVEGGESKVGDPKQTLTVESNSIFSGKVLVRGDLDVAGTIKVGGSLSLPGISVSGNSNFDQIQANNLGIAGNVSIQGILTVQKNIVSSGGASFGGPISAPQLSVGSLQLTGDLSLTRHIDAGGGTPGKTDGSALGGGGTASVSGTDTAGTLTINTGNGPNAGCFATINFTQRFNGTPHVVVTPVGSAAGSLNYYINRNNATFSICTANAAPAGQSFSFDWIAID